MFKKTFIAAAIAVTLVSTVGAQAADPTQGRLDQREAARKQQQFNKCTKFSNRVFNDCMGRANGDTFRQRQCRQTLRSNITECRKRYQ